MKRRSTYISIKTYLNHSLRLQLIWNYIFLPFTLSLPLVFFYLFIELFIYLVIFIFIICIYFMTFTFYINWCQSPVSCFIILALTFPFETTALWDVYWWQQCVCVFGGCRGWVVYMFMGWRVGVKLMSVNSVF